MIHMAYRILHIKSRDWLANWQCDKLSFIYQKRIWIIFVYLNSQLRNQDYLVEDNEILDLKHIPWLQIRLNLFQSQKSFPKSLKILLNPDNPQLIQS